ncbi:MAG: SDR family oxidoreductase [Candidatus Omnitrophica bacterium]|nr:SDR family oxidoreductase [Candidatus Omnitrophota bacterium]
MKNKKVVLITGASSGIGLAACKLFVEKGWHVIGAARRKMKKNKFISRYHQTDLEDPGSIHDLIKSVKQKEKRLDVLVNNAAHQVCKSLSQTSLKEWRQVFAVNVDGPFLLVKGALPLLNKSKGAIVNVSSVHAFASSQNISSYAASKGALVSLTRNMAIELGAKGIRANAVVPGAVCTPMLEEGLIRVNGSRKGLKKQIDNIAKKQLLGQVGRPEEIAKIIYFLSDNAQSSFMTGQAVVADGGALAKLATE